MPGLGSSELFSWPILSINHKPRKGREESDQLCLLFPDKFGLAIISDKSQNCPMDDY
jgi:hypothetical protein